MSGRSLAADRRQKAKTETKSGQGDKATGSAEVATYGSSDRPRQSLTSRGRSALKFASGGAAAPPLLLGLGGPL